MAFNKFNFPITVRSIWLVLLAVAATLAFIHSRWILFSLCVLVALLVIRSLIGYFNSINRKLSFFFDSIRNEDSMLHFPEGGKYGPTKELSRSLNKVNQIISEIKIKNERKERFFLEFMKHSATGLMAVDEKGYIEIVNDAALQLFNTGVLVHIERLKQINKDFYETISILKPFQSKTIKLLIDDELHQVLIKMVELKFGQKVFKIYSLNDIKSELDEKEMETWQKLIRILTHEIMNSIAPISSISNTLLNYFKDGKQVSAKELKNLEHGLDVINERSKGLIHFVENYRKLTKIPKPIFREIIIADWLESICFLFRERQLNDGIRLEVSNDFRESSFLGDQKLLTQVVLNLLNNAADALSQVADKHLSIHISGSGKGGISMKFIDNGPGISHENLDQIFIPFFTTKENGSGIGLSLSRQIVNLHKGQLSARSVPGKETVFEIRI